MNTLITGKIRRQLFIAMLVIIFTLVAIAAPLIHYSYRSYTDANDSLQHLRILQVLVDMCNQISRERGPSNLAMTTPNNLEHIKALQQYRQRVNQHLITITKILEQSGYSNLAEHIQKKLMNQLNFARDKIDQYIQHPDQQTSQAMYGAIMAMFRAWDQSYAILKQFYYQTNNEDKEIADYFTVIFLLTELRDQSGRIASNITPAMSFSEAIPELNLDRSQQNQQNILYLWQIIQSLSEPKLASTSYQRVKNHVDQQFIKQGLNLISQSWLNNTAQQHYSISAEQLTLRFSEKLKILVELQNYVIQHSIEKVLENKMKAQWAFISTIAIIILSLSIILFILLYIHRHIFQPLLCVQNNILALAEGKEFQPSISITSQQNEFFVLFEALAKLQDMLQQRKRLETELSKMANTDPLTGINNRLALEQYLQRELDQNPNLQHLALIMIDVDNFKKINDQYGHDVGDKALSWIAQQLKSYNTHQDLVIRYGGDEFLIVCKNMTTESLWQLAQHLKRQIQQQPLILTTSQQLTLAISMGIALNQHSWDILFSKADQALLHAKLLGKNKIELIA